jgi:hypothetical protein
MSNNEQLTKGHSIFLRLAICSVSIVGFLAGKGLFALHDYGLPVWPIVRESLFVGTFVGILAPPLTKILVRTSSSLMKNESNAR